MACRQSDLLAAQILCDRTHAVWRGRQLWLGCHHEHRTQGRSDLASGLLQQIPAASRRSSAAGLPKSVSGQLRMRSARGLLDRREKDRTLTTAGTVTVHGSAAGFAQEIAVGGHRLTGDEPLSFGGTDTGPDPYGLLLAALGSCMSITVAMYARRKQWPLDAVTVRLGHSRIHSADCERCETETLLDHIDCELEFTGPLTAQQRGRLL